MLRNLWRKAWRKMFLASVAGLAAGALATDTLAQDVDVGALLKRLERLEQQNQELHNKLASPVATESGGVNAKTVEDIVGNYLARQAEAKKKEEAKKAPEFVAVGSDLNVKTTWKDGISFATTNGDFKMHVGGRVHFDWGWWEPHGDINPAADDDPNTLWRDGADFRRGRLRVDATCWEIINTVIELDFATPDSTAVSSTFTDVYMEITQLPWIGTFRVGRFKEPFSIEELTSSRYMNTIERSIAHSAFVPSRRLGFMFTNTVTEQERGTWAAGIFRADSGGNGGFDDGDGEYSVAARATALPIWAHEGRCLLHVGGAWVNFNHNGNSGDDPRYRTRPSMRIGNPPFILDTAALTDVKEVNLYGGELAGNLGSLSFMSEIYAAQNHAETPAAGNPLYWGGYVQASYFLTGEHRPYNKKSGVWDRVRPIEPFYLVRGGSDDEGRRVLFGRGAVELVARWAYLDLSSDGRNVSSTDAGGFPGYVQDMTLGVNWYFNPNFKYMVNYVRAWRSLADAERENGIVDGLVMRFAWDF